MYAQAHCQVLELYKTSTQWTIKIIQLLKCSPVGSKHKLHVRLKHMLLVVAKAFGGSNYNAQHPQQKVNH